MDPKRRFMKNLLFFDIDGTLITDDERHMFPADAAAALTAARSAGNLCFINTGRVRCNVETYITAPGFDGLVCGCGTYIEYHGRVLHRHEISRERCHQLAHICRECRMQAFFEHTDVAFYDAGLDMPYILPAVDSMRQQGRPMPGDIDAPDFRFDKFSGWFDETSDVARFRREIEKDFVYIDRGEMAWESGEDGRERKTAFFEVEPVGYSKASGMRFLMEYFGVDRDAVYAFGDSNNDLEMMEYAGHSICMAGGSEACKAAADYVTAAVDEGGLHQALEHFRLLS